MSIEYKKIRTFVQKGIDAYVKPIKTYFLEEAVKENDRAQDAENRIENEIEPLMSNIDNTQQILNTNIDTLESDATAQTNQMESTINAHLVAVNPHEDKLRQMLTISSTDPTAANGVNDSFWLTYLNPSVSWVVGAWSACTVECNGGVRNRSVNCVRNDGAVVVDSLCTAVGLSKPVSQEPCNTQPCLYLRTTTNSNCGFTCSHQPMCTAKTVNVDNTNGQYVHIGSFTLPNPKGYNYYWRFPFRVYDVSIWVKLAITSSVKPSITDIPMLCADYAPKSWNPPRITGFSAYRCELGFPNEQRNGSIWILARIPASYVGLDGNISAYLYTADRSNYSGNTLYFHSDEHSGTSDYCSRVCLG